MNVLTSGTASRGSDCSGKTSSSTLRNSGLELGNALSRDGSGGEGQDNGGVLHLESNECKVQKRVSMDEIAK